MHVYCVFEKKSFVATSQAPFRSTFDRSRLLGDIDNLVNLFCNRFDMAVQRATQRTSGLLVSMLDPKQRVWHLVIQFSQPFVWTNHQSTFVFPFLLGWASLYTFDSSQLPQICCQLGALAIMATQITLPFSCISPLKYIGPKKWMYFSIQPKIGLL